MALRRTGAATVTVAMLAVVCGSGNGTPPGGQQAMPASSGGGPYADIPQVHPGYEGYPRSEAGTERRSDEPGALPIPPVFPGYPGFPELIPDDEPQPSPGDPEPSEGAEQPGGADCAVDEIMEPSCGVWWGASPYKGDPRPLEKAADRKMDIVYTWNGIDEKEVPSDKEVALAAEGRIIHANIEARRFDRKGHPPVDYSAIIGGEFDDSLKAQARRIAALRAPVFITFDHEADAGKRYGERGTPEEFVEAWRHIVDLYRGEGADNAVYVWNVTGWPSNLDRLGKLWPGNDYVDWLSWEAYNMTGCELMNDWDHVLSFEEALRPAYEWIQEEGPDHGIDPDKPVMIGEMGTVPLESDKATEDWYTAIPEVLEKYERVKAVKVWDGKTAPTCDFRVLENDGALRGFTDAGDDPYVRIPDQTRKAVTEALETRDRLEADD